MGVKDFFLSSSITRMNIEQIQGSLSEKLKFKFSLFRDDKIQLVCKNVPSVNLTLKFFHSQFYVRFQLKSRLVLSFEFEFSPH